MSEWILASSILILLIIFIRCLFRDKIALRVRYALWLVVAVRLLCPFSISQSSLSILNFLEWDMAMTETEDHDRFIEGEGEKEGSGLGTKSDAEEAFWEGEKEGSGPGTISDMEDGGGAFYGISKEESKAEGKRYEGQLKIPTGKSKAGEDNPAAESESNGAGYGNWKAAFIFVWLAGCIAVASAVAVINGNYRRKVYKSRIKYRTNTESVLPVYLSAVTATPCMFGLFRPAVYLPPEVKGDERKLKYVLCHENTHYLHLDHLWAVVRVICVCVHWYNPLVWLAAELSRQDCELACDEKALKLLDREEQIDYGRILLDFSVQGDGLPGGLQLSTAVSGGKRHLKERLLMIVGHPRRPVSAVILTAAMVLVVSAATFTDSVRNQEISEEIPEVEDMDETQNMKGADGSGDRPETGTGEHGVQNTSIVSVDLNDGEDYILKIGGEIVGEDGSYRIGQMDLNRIRGRKEETIQTVRLEDVKVLYTRPLAEIKSDGGDMWACSSAEEALFAKALCTAESLPEYAAEKFQGKENGKTVAELFTGGILVADLNFDGYQDFGLQGRSETGNVPYYCFLWNPSEGQFEPAYRIPNLSVDEEARMLLSETSDGEELQSVKYYRFDENRMLHMVRYTEKNQAPDALFPTLDLTYCEVPYGLPAVDEWDYGTRYGGALAQRFVYWAKEALTELYEWSGTKLDTVCFTMTDFGDICFANTPEDIKASRTFYDRCYGEQAGFRSCIPNMSLSTERVVWYSPVVQWRVPENLKQMTDEEVVLWYFARSAVAEGETMAAIERSNVGSYIIKTEVGNYYEMALEASTREVHDIYGPYDDYPDH